MAIVKEWLKTLANTNTSDESDSKAMQNILRSTGFPNAVVTCGIVYLEGKGEPVDIHMMAKTLCRIGGIS